MNITVSNSLGGVETLIRKKVESAWKSLGKANAEAAEFGAKTAQSYTKSRPGAKTGKAGRVDTGAMVEAIRWEPVSFSADLIQSRYGFIDEFEEYFRMQTITGFRNVRSGDRIEPTFALRDSIQPTRDYAIKAGRDAI